MQRVIFPLLLAVIVLQSVQRADACGDKFLLVGRGVRFQHAYAAIYPARIVIMARPRGGTLTAIHDPKFPQALERAGHHVSVVSDATRLDTLVKQGDVDLVLADWADLAALKVSNAIAPATVLPIMDKPTKAESASCGQQYNCQLKASDKVEQFLTVIDNTMKGRVRAQKH